VLPLRQGTIRTGYKAACGYYDQETARLADDGTPYDELRREHPLMTDLEIRSHLAKFLFRGDEVELPIRSLSGGERARLALAKLVLTEPSWLALDEPTNHLDLPGRTALEEMLSEFPGALVVISHDRQFLAGLATRVVEVKDGRLREFPGNYSDYKRALEEESAAADAAKAEREARARAERRKAEEKARRDAEKAQAQAAKKGGQRAPGGDKRKKPRNPWALEKLESAIIELEGEREELLARMAAEDTYKDAELLKETQFRLAEVERDLEEKNAEWAGWD